MSQDKILKDKIQETRFHSQVINKNLQSLLNYYFHKDWQVRNQLLILQGLS